MYSQTVLEHFNHPHRGPSREEADVVGQAGVPGEGSYMLLFLCCEGERITRAGYDTYGCPASQACGSFLCGWVEGKTFDEAAVLTAEDLTKVLGGLPLGKEHAAINAVAALMSALRQLAQARVGAQR